MGIPNLEPGRDSPTAAQCRPRLSDPGAQHPCPAAPSLPWCGPCKAPWGVRPRMSSAGSAVVGSGTAWKMGQRADSPGGLERHPALLPGRAGFQSLSNPNGPAATLTRRLSFLLPCPRLRLEQQFRTLEFSGKFSKTDSPCPESEAAAGATATSSCCCKVPAGPLPQVQTAEGAARRGAARRGAGRPPRPPPARPRGTVGDSH